MKAAYWLIALLFSPTLRVSAQSMQMDNMVYEPTIYTPQLYAGNDATTFPVLFLGENGFLSLEFDELMPQGARQSDFMVDFVHCDADWQPSPLQWMEYWDGFMQNRITQYAQGNMPLVPYMHYLHSFPAEGNAFKRSGNYIVRVLRDGDESQPVLTMRFVVAERKTDAALVGIIRNNNRLPMSEMRIQLNAGSLSDIDPLQQMRVNLLQNFRWDNAQTNLTPAFWNDHSYQYRLNVMQTFSSGQEFRRVNLRSVRMNLEGVKGYIPEEAGVSAYLYPDAPIGKSAATGVRDYNGGYIVRTDDNPYPDTDGDYISTHFTLKVPEQTGKNVFLIGGFSLWQPDSRYQMTYSPVEQCYRAEVLLKQGTYDYGYGVSPAADTHTRFNEPWNGIASEGENFYTLLVYYKGFGDRTHRVVGCHALNYQE